MQYINFCIYSTIHLVCFMTILVWIANGKNFKVLNMIKKKCLCSRYSLSNKIECLIFITLMFQTKKFITSFDLLFLDDSLGLSLVPL